MRLRSLLVAIVMCAFAIPLSAQAGITMAIAANMQPVMERMKPMIEKEVGVKLDIIPGSSGKLSAQVAEGAPFDIFVSADMKYAEDLFAKGFAIAHARQYARGVLVLWTANKDLRPSADLSWLLAGNIKKIAIANAATAPYGRAAEEALRYYKLYDKLKEKLVYGESIGQTQQFIASGSADIGFIARSQAVAGEMNGKGKFVEVDSKAYSPINQGAVILKHGMANNAAAVRKVYEFLYSDKAKALFKEYGYIVQ
jgi:molybdate transport system substrate-binding protein